MKKAAGNSVVSGKWQATDYATYVMCLLPAIAFVSLACAAYDPRPAQGLVFHTWAESDLHTIDALEADLPRIQIHEERKLKTFELMIKSFGRWICAHEYQRNPLRKRGCYR